MKLITNVDTDKSNHNTWMAETHVILIPLDMAGNKSPVPGTDPWIYTHDVGKC